MLAPVAGTQREVSDLPDPVFATGLVGPGAAISPRPGEQSAVSPIEGVLAKLYPHAFLVLSDQGPGVLVHLGIDTVHLQGEGFTELVREQSRVRAGQEVLRWDPAHVERSGRSPMCAVVVMDCPFETVALSEPGSAVEAAAPLFSIDVPPGERPAG